MFDILNIMPQTNSYDYGIFSIANATELLYGRNPLKCVWDIPKMRSYLIRSFEQGRMDCLPNNGYHLVALLNIMKEKLYTVFAGCLMTNQRL